MVVVVVVVVVFCCFCLLLLLLLLHRENLRVQECSCDGGDWQVYEDSVELQLLFMKQRDELCRHGEVLLTPALDFTVEQLTSKIDDQRREQHDDDDDRKRHATSAATGIKPASAQVRSPV